MLEPFSSDILWIVIVGFIIAFILSFGIGANDVANSFGTSVGSKVITLFQACCLATVFEIAGALLIGYKVSDTMRKGILDINVYKNSETTLMLGSISALSASAAWLLLATFFKLPISGTHSIVGATVGYSLVGKGLDGVQWKMLGKIVASWFVSPFLSGITSLAILWIIKTFILIKADPLEAGLVALPIFYGFTILVNLFSVIHNGPKLLHMENLPFWMVCTISISVSVFFMIIIWIFVVPWQRRKIKQDDNRSPVNFNIGGSTDTSPEGSPKKSNRTTDRQLTVISETTELQAMEHNRSSAKYIFSPQTADNNGYSSAESENINPALSPNSSGVPLILNKSFSKRPGQNTTIEVYEGVEMENKSVSKLFSFLQVLTAMFGSFAHGGNDVSNAIGPLVTLWLIYSEGTVQQKSETPLFILFYGGAGISLGLWLWGRRVIETIGENLTKITPSTGFTIEIGAAFTVLLASKLGIPISTTHCKVGSVVMIGYFTSKKGVDWHLFRNIIFAWVITVPIAALLSAGIMFGLSFIY